MLTGANFIGTKTSAKGSVTFQTRNPARNTLLATIFYEASDDEINAACETAHRSLTELRVLPKIQLANFLQLVRSEFENSKHQILCQYLLESGLTQDRALAEFERTTQLLSDYASFIELNNFPECSIDIPENPALPDLRKTHIGIGPVVIFGASNFPLAYSTLGGDTVSAWVAGCPVIVKSHPMHAGTGELVSRCIVEAVGKSGMPEGIFSNLNGKSFEVGEKLVRHPLIKAVGFTGSLKGGRALYDLASRRSEPIPVFAEMGSLNPVVLFDKSTDKVSKQAILLARSVTTDAGQFCTKPGVIFVNSNISEFFVGELELALSDSATYSMLHEEIYMRYIKRLDEVNQTNGVRQRRFTKEGALSLEGIIAISQTTVNYLLNEETLRDEVFGPHILVVEYEELNEVESALKQLGGQLTISLFCNDSAQIEHSTFMQVAYDIAGRVIWNGVPTGVAVNSSSNHGGPYPATTDSRFSSVGLDSWKRFARFVTWQGAPQKLLPDALRNENPLGIVRKVNGKLTNLSWK